MWTLDGAFSHATEQCEAECRKRFYLLPPEQMLPVYG
jgi:hypothetical protein